MPSYNLSPGFELSSSVPSEQKGSLTDEEKIGKTILGAVNHTTPNNLNSVTIPTTISFRGDVVRVPGVDPKTSAFALQKGAKKAVIAYVNKLPSKAKIAALENAVNPAEQLCGFFATVRKCDPTDMGKGSFAEIRLKGAQEKIAAMEGNTPGEKMYRMLIAEKEYGAKSAFFVSILFDHEVIKVRISIFTYTIALEKNAKEQVIAYIDGLDLEEKKNALDAALDAKTQLFAFFAVDRQGYHTSLSKGSFKRLAEMRIAVGCQSSSEQDVPLKIGVSS